MARTREVYEKFIKRTGEVLTSSVDARFSGTQNTQLQEQIRELMVALTSAQAITAVEYAWSQIDYASGDQLLREIELVTNATPSSPGDSGRKQAGEDLETGKGSLEDLLGGWLPDWVKRLLKVLNQLLKLLT